MNHEAIGQIFFDETYTVPAQETAERMMAALPTCELRASVLVDAMATAYLVALLKAICVRELTPHLDAPHEAIATTDIECKHCGTVPGGAPLRVAGWVDQVRAHDVTFWVYAQDDHEEVCKGTVKLTVAPRAHLERALWRKAQALTRKALFASA
jgi:predicted thioesterase